MFVYKFTFLKIKKNPQYRYTQQIKFLNKVVLIVQKKIYLTI